MRNGLILVLMLAALPIVAAGDEFASSVRPVLVEKCSVCHAAEKPDNKRPFLRATSAADVSKERGLWRGVGTLSGAADRGVIASAEALDQRG